MSLKSDNELCHLLGLNPNKCSIRRTITGKQLKSLGLTFIKYTVTSERHGPVQYQDGRVEDAGWCYGLHFVAEGFECTKEWQVWSNPNHPCLSDPLWDNFRVCAKWKRPVLLDDNQKIEFTYYPPFYVHMGVVFSAEYLNLGPRQEL